MVSRNFLSPRSTRLLLDRTKLKTTPPRILFGVSQMSLLETVDNRKLTFITLLAIWLDFCPSVCSEFNKVVILVERFSVQRLGLRGPQRAIDMKTQFQNLILSFISCKKNTNRINVRLSIPNMLCRTISKCSGLICLAKRYF